MSDTTRRTFLSSLAIVSACLATATASWLLPASVQIVDWTSSPARIALFAPLSGLWLALGVAAVVTAALLFTAGPGRSRLARVVAPVSVLWLWTIPYWPWLADRVPALLILAGPVRWFLVAAAAAGALLECRWLNSWQFPQPRRRTIFLITLGLYVALGLRSYAKLGIGGDEPHYLVITHSLLADRDLQIENNHTNRDYREFFGGDLRPDYLRRGKNGAIYSIHAPGLPVLLLPGYAAAGARGAVVTMCVFGALAALAIYDVALVVGGVGAALLTWVAVCLTVPFLPHTWMLYPETAGAAIVAWAVLWLVEPPPSRPLSWIWRGACLSVLPWLHTKFVVFLGMLAICLAWRIRTRIRDLLAFFLPIALSSVAWLGFFYAVYGSLDPQAPYGAYTQQYVRFVNIPRSLLGTLFDQKFGLLVYSPIYCAAAMGLAVMLRDSRLRPIALALVAAVAPFVISSTRLYMWWGGLSAPGRFLVPVLPLIAPAVAVAFAHATGRLTRATFGTWLALSVVIAALGVVIPERAFLFSTPHGVARFLEVAEGSAPMSSSLPTFTEENWVGPLSGVLPWTIAAALALGAGALARGSSVYWVSAIESGTFLFLGSLLTTPAAPAIRAESARRGQLALMTAYDPNRLRTFDYRTSSRLAQADLLHEMTLSIPRAADQPLDAQGRIAGPFAVPAGRYLARVWFAGSQLRDGDLLVSPRRGGPLARQTGPLGNPATLPFDMPAPIPVWISLSDGSSARAVQRVELEPVLIVPRSQRVAVRAVEQIEGRPNAYILYVNDETFPEGGVFWTHADNRGEVLVAAADASQIVLTLHVGPAAGIVKLSVAGMRLDLDMQPNETREIVAPVPPGGAPVAVSVQAPGSFQPARVDPKSTDTRALGCQVRVSLR